MGDMEFVGCAHEAAMPRSGFEYTQGVERGQRNLSVFLTEKRHHKSIFRGEQDIQNQRIPTLQ